MILATLIIPTCNRLPELRQCLESLAVQLPFDGSVEVVVTDDSDNDACRDMIARVLPLARWHWGPRRGPAANRNSATRLAKGKWLIFLDDDCKPGPGYLSGYLQAIRSSPPWYSVLEGLTRRMPAPPSLLWEAPQSLKNHGHLSCSCNFAIRAEVFHAVQGFDERYQGGVYAEDVDLSARLLKAGYKMDFVPAAEVVHPIRPVPDAEKLAKRWEGKVIFAFDQGASAFTVSWRLPWHALRVIHSRFRCQPWTRDNARAAAIFLKEWIFVVLKTPAWVKRWAAAPRSSFWQACGGGVPKHGF